MKKIAIFLIIALCLCGTSTLFAASSTPAQIQQLQGAGAFPLKDGSNIAVVRIGVDPKSIGKGLTSTLAQLKQIVVIGCAAGVCQRAKILAGLGYFENQFSFSKPVKLGTHFPMQVVACSRLGCVFSKLQVKVSR